MAFRSLFASTPIGIPIHSLSLSLVNQERDRLRTSTDLTPGAPHQALPLTHYRF